MRAANSTPISNTDQAGPASVKVLHNDPDKLAFIACDKGTALVWCHKAPASVTVDGKPAQLRHESGVVRIALTSVNCIAHGKRVAL